MTLILRGKTWYLKRRVPRRYAAVADAPWIVVTLKTDSREEAERKAGQVWDQYTLGWEARLRGAGDDARARFDAARDLAQSRGFRFREAAQLASRASLQEVVGRVVASIDSSSGSIRPLDGEALLGTARRPAMTVTEALAEYWTLTADQVRGKDANQLRIWKNQRKRAVRNFVDVIGDLDLADITRDHMLDYRQWWWERMQADDLTANSANKDITTLSALLKLVNRMKRLQIGLPLESLGFRDDEDETRLSFSDDWIREKLLAAGALDGMNAEARGILLAMINTGCRPSELVGLRAKHIVLDHPCPHIAIRPDGRHLKTQQSRRDIPLVGASLKAMEDHPDGFPRYRGKGTLSGTANKFLRENGLMETPGHTMYGLRHSFEDRMLAAGIDGRIRADLMGHKLDRPRYGAGGRLKQVTELLQAIAL